MTQKINILFVHPTPYLNGVTRWLADLINRLDRSSFNVFLVVPPGSALESLIAVRDLVIEHQPISPLGRHPARAFRHVVFHRRESMALARLASRFHADVVYGSTITATQALAAAVHLRKPCVIHVHEGPQLFPSFLYRNWVCRVGKQAALILVVSKEIAGAFHDYAAKVVCVDNGLDLGRFQNLPHKQRRPDRRGTEFRILCVSHLMKGKGQHELVQRLPAILAKCPGARVTFVGGTNGVRRNEDFVGSLKAIARQSGVTDRMEFAGPQTDLAPWFRACDTFVNTSPYETFGLTILEALASGVPVVSRPVGVVRELMGRQAAGLHVVQESWDELPAILERIDLEGFSDYRLQRTALLEPYQIDRHVARIETLLKQVKPAHAELG